MIKRLLRLLFLIVILLPFNARAECDRARLTELSSIAGNVRFSATYRPQGDNVVYTVDISNITDDIYVAESSGTIFTKDFSSKDYEFNDGTVYIIYSNDPNCYGLELMTKSFSLPNYNPYSRLDICKKYPNDSHCSIWNATYFDGELDFTEELNKIYSADYNEDYVIDEENASIYNYLPIYIFVTAIFLAFIFILFVVRRKRK